MTPATELLYAYAYAYKYFHVPLPTGNIVIQRHLFARALLVAMPALAGCPEGVAPTSPVGAPKSESAADPVETAGSVQFTATSYPGVEGTSVTVTVTRIGGDTGRVRVRYGTSDGTAAAGSDYSAVDGTLDWKDGEAGAKSFSVSLLDDAANEVDETLVVTLSAPQRATLRDPYEAALTIVDNDAAPAPAYQRLTFEGDWEHTEPDVRIDPIDPNHALVSWMQKPAGGDLNDCATAVTFDGGATWNRHVFPKFGHAACADISMAFAPFGPPEKGPGQTVYVTSIGYGAPGGVGDGDGVDTYKPEAGLAGQIYLFRSDDGGLTWSEPTVVYDWADPRAPAAFDRPWIAVDHSHGPFRGRIYVSDMTVFVQQASPRVYLKYSDDGGTTFSPPIEVDRTLGDAGRATAFATMAVGADGRVMLVYRAWATGLSDDQPDEDGNLADTLHAAGVPENSNGVGHVSERSGEGYCIACFSAASIQFSGSSLNPDPDANYALMTPAERPYAIAWSMLPFVVSGAPRNSEESPTYATVAADPKVPGRFAAVLIESRYSKEAQANDYRHVPPGYSTTGNPVLDLDVSFTWSDDWGGHWSRPVRVNDDLIGTGVIQDRPWLTFDPVSGLPVVAWRDRRNALEPQGPGNGVMSDLYAARLMAFGKRDWGDAPQSVSQPDSVNQRRYEDAPRFSTNHRLSSPIQGQHGGGFTPKSSLSDSFFSIAVAPRIDDAARSATWAVWAPILISQGNNTVPDSVADLESGTRQIMLRIWDPQGAIDLTPFDPSGGSP